MACWILALFCHLHLQLQEKSMCAYMHTMMLSCNDAVRTNDKVIRGERHLKGGMTEADEREREMAFGAVRDAEGRTQCIHSSSGIYSCPEERGEWGCGLSCGFRSARQRERKWEARGTSDVSERG